MKSNIKLIGMLIAFAFASPSFAEGEKRVKIDVSELSESRVSSENSKPSPSKSDTNSKKSSGSSAKEQIPLSLPLMANEPTRSPFLDTKQVVYPYDPNTSYPVVTRPGVYTQIDLPDGFVVEGFYLSNSNEEDWTQSVSKDGRHIFIKPTRGGLFNSGSIISGDTSYLLAIASEDEGEWFQRVKWTLTKAQMKKYNPTIKKQELAEDEGESKNTFFENYSAESNSGTVYKKEGVDSAKINTNWKIEGEARFKPVSVYDDGKFTYIKFAKNLGELPALFSIPEEGAPELVNYVIVGDEQSQIKVSRVLSGALLKIGKSEVKLSNQNLNRGFSFSNIFGKSNSQANGNSNPLSQQ